MNELSPNVIPGSLLFGHIKDLILFDPNEKTSIPVWTRAKKTRATNTKIYYTTAVSHSHLGFGFYVVIIMLS